MKEDKSAKNEKKKAKGPNPKNTWQQHPNIKSPAARERAYLIEAGLFQNSSKSKKLEILDPSIDLMNSPEVKFGRMLASPDQRVRHSTIQKLSQYLKKRCDLSNEAGGISELDLMKLWKGMWYTLYLCDKTPVQDDVSKKLCQLLWSFKGTDEEDEYAGTLYLEMENTVDSDEIDHDDEDVDEVSDDEEEGFMDDDDDDDLGDEEDDEELEMEQEDDMDLEEEDEEQSHSYDDSDSSNNGEKSVDDAEMKHCRGAHLASLYVRTFFRTVRREWPNMDKYRVDKFYTCMRFMLREVYIYMSKRHWNLGIIRLFNDTIFEEILSQVPNGPRYHLIDISLEELAQVSADSALPLTEATFIDCMEPYFALLQTLEDATVHSRIVEKILRRFLMEYSVVSCNSTAEDAIRVNFFTHVHVGTVAKFIFDVASDETTQDRYRKILYDVHKEYMKKLKEVGQDVMIEDDSDGDVYDDEDDDVKPNSHTEHAKDNELHSSKPDQRKATTVTNLHQQVKNNDKRKTLSSASKGMNDVKEIKEVVKNNFDGKVPKDNKVKETGPSFKTSKVSNQLSGSHHPSLSASAETRTSVVPVNNTKDCKVDQCPAILSKTHEKDVKKSNSASGNPANKTTGNKLDKLVISSKTHEKDEKAFETTKISTKLQEPLSMPQETSGKHSQSLKKAKEPEKTISTEKEKVITISLSEQKASKMFEKSKNFPESVKQAKPKITESAKKRVKFGKDMSKTYSASLTDLRKIDPKAILEKRPGESILRISPVRKRNASDEMNKQVKGKKKPKH